MSPEEEAANRMLENLKARIRNFNPNERPSIKEIKQRFADEIEGTPEQKAFHVKMRMRTRHALQEGYYKEGMP